MLRARDGSGMSDRTRGASPVSALAGSFLVSATIPPRASADAGMYPFSIPAVRALMAPGALEFHPQVTFLVGENGTGKSMLIEAIAIAAGFNAEGGSKNFNFATKPTESS